MADENTQDFNEEKEVEELEEKLEEENKKEDNNNAEDDNKEVKKEEETKEEEEDDDEEPVIRKSVKDYVIDRKNKQIEKLKKSKEEESNNNIDDDDDSFTKEDKEAINKVVSKETEPLKEVLKSQLDKEELDAVIAKHPEAKSFRKKISKYMNHEAYQSVPVENIYLMLAGQKNIVQTKKEQAKISDKENQTGGHTHRNSGGKEQDYANMSDKEFDDLDQKLMTGQL